MSTFPQKRTIRKYININTKFRPYIKGNQQSNTDFLITLPSPVRNVMSIKLKSFTAPQTQYTFTRDQKNNSFEVVFNGVATRITVLPGKYYTFENKKLFDQINPQLAPFGIEMVYLADQLSYAFKGNNIANVEINFDVNNNYIYNTFGYICGFQKPFYSKDPKYAGRFPEALCKKNNGLVGGITNLNGVNYYLADEPVILPNLSKYFLLYLDDFQNNVENTFIEGIFPSNNSMKNVIAKINTNSGTQNTFYETDVDESFNRVYTGPVTISKLDIKLFTDNDIIVDFNQANYTFLLELDCLLV